MRLSTILVGITISWASYAQDTTIYGKDMADKKIAYGIMLDTGKLDMVVPSMEETLGRGRTRGYVTQWKGVEFDFLDKPMMLRISDRVEKGGNRYGYLNARKSQKKNKKVLSEIEGENYRRLMVEFFYKDYSLVRMTNKQFQEVYHWFFNMMPEQDREILKLHKRLSPERERSVFRDKYFEKQKDGFEERYDMGLSHAYESKADSILNHLLKINNKRMGRDGMHRFFNQKIDGVETKFRIQVHECVIKEKATGMGFNSFTTKKYEERRKANLKTNERLGIIIYFNKNSPFTWRHARFTADEIKLVRALRDDLLK